MVFGDNVRARRAARALPRTPIQRGRGRGRKRRQEGMGNEITPSPTAIPHHTPHNKERQEHNTPRPSTALPPSSPHTQHHHNTQKNKTHKDREHHEENGGNTKGGHHNTTRHHPSTRPPTHRRGGHQHTDGDANDTAALQSSCHPPSNDGTPPPTTAPSSWWMRGEWTEDTPPHEHLGDYSPRTTGHGNKTVHDTTAVLTTTHRARQDTDHTAHRAEQDNSTHHRHSTGHTEERRTPSTHPLSHCSRSQRSTNDHDQR